MGRLYIQLIDNTSDLLKLSINLKAHMTWCFEYNGDSAYWANLRHYVRRTSWITFIVLKIICWNDFRRMLQILDSRLHLQICERVSWGQNQKRFVTVVRYTNPLSNVIAWRNTFGNVGKIPLVDALIFIPPAALINRVNGYPITHFTLSPAGI